MSEGLIDALWYLARGAGVVGLVLLTISVVLGIASRSGRPAFGLPRFAVALVHRNASLIAVGLVAIHVTSLFFDPYAQLRLADLVIPFDATYRPLWVGLGTLAADCLFLVVITSLLRVRIGVRTWRAIHWVSYGLWPAAWLHGFFSGSDADSGWLRGTAIACVLAVAGAGVWRCVPGFAEGSRVRLPPPRQATRATAQSATAQSAAAQSATARSAAGRDGRT